MKAGVITTGAGSILILTSCASFEDPDLVNALQSKGITKYIAYEIPEDIVKNQYGQHYSVIMDDRKQSDVLRVVDVDGQRIFKNIPLSAMSRPFCHEEAAVWRRAA